MATSTVRAVVGARVSIMTDGKESHLAQHAKCEAYAEAQGWEVVGEISDLGESAISKSPWERPDLRSWLDRPEDWTALIFAKTDRVFRSAADCVRLAEFCKEHRKILVLVDDGIRLDFYNDDSTRDPFAAAMSKVFLILASVFAEIEGQRFRQRALDRVTQFRHQPRWSHGVPPYGMQVVDRPEGGKCLAHDAEAQRVLHDIAARLLAGDSLTRIVTLLNDTGVPSPAERLRQRTGKPLRGSKWTIVSLTAILSSPATMGVKLAKGKPVLDASGEPVLVGPASFDPDTWGRIQLELAQRKQSGTRRRHSTNPLLGVAKCGVCGKNMRQLIQTGKSNRYYLCGASPKACPGVLVNADDAEERVESAFLHVHADRKIQTRVWQAGSDHSAELDQVERTIAALREDREMGLYATETDEIVFRGQMSSLVSKRAQLASQPVVKAGWIQVESDKTYGQVWNASTPEEKRTMLVDAGVRLDVTDRFHYGTYIDLDRALGEGASGKELYDEIERRAAIERARWGVPD